MRPLTERPKPHKLCRECGKRYLEDGIRTRLCTKCWGNKRTGKRK